jgi:hypothetical protein
MGALSGFVGSTPGFAEEAAACFRRDGFVVVKDALSPDRLAKIRQGAPSHGRCGYSHAPSSGFTIFMHGSPYKAGRAA